MAEDGKQQTGSMMGVGTAIGVAIGAGIGAAIDNMGLGIGIGIAIGLALGIAWNGARLRKSGGAGEPPADGQPDGGKNR